MSALKDTLIMAKRSLHHTIKSADTIITVAATPIGVLLLFVFVFGGMFKGDDTSYINFITPSVALMAVTSGIAYAAFRLNNDLTKGIVNRFKTMPISQSSILNGHVVSSVVSNLVSVAVVIGAAFLAGFRPDNAGLSDWLGFTGLMALFTLATSWLAMVFGLLAKSAEGAGAFSYAFIALLFVSSAFVPTESMTPGVRAFAEHQPMTPIIETLRSFLIDGTAGSSAGAAVAWCLGMLVVGYFAALAVYKRKTA